MSRRVHHISRIALVAVALLIGCSDTDRAQPTTGTSPIDSASAGHLLAVGDWGSGTPEQGEVAQQMAEYAGEHPVVRILTTGDNFYSNDSDELMMPFEWAVASEVPFWITWGNHDVESSRRMEVVDDVFDSPPRWGLYEWGDVDIIVLDSTQSRNELQTHFLSEVMANREDPAVVVFHHPVYSCGPHGSSEQIADEWLGSFDDDVVLVLSGHDHMYERFEVAGIAYVVTGGGGRFLTELSPCPAGHPELIAGGEIHHFLALEQDDGLQVTSIAADGSVVDRFSVALD